MDKNDLLKNLQRLFKRTINDFDFIKNELEFAKALSDLDAEALKEVINRGFSVSEYEEVHGSTLVKSIYSSSDLIISIFKNYWPKKYLEYYFNVLPTMDRNNLVEQVKSEMDNVLKSLVDVMDVLYSNGADINACNFRENEDSIIGVLMNKTTTVETVSAFHTMIKMLDQFQSIQLVDWFLDKHDFKITEEDGIISSLVRLDSSLSTEVLNKLLLNGLKLDTYNVDDTSYEYSSLHECAMVGGTRTQKDKMNLLYQFASSDQKARYMEACEILKTAEEDKKINGIIK